MSGLTHLTGQVQAWVAQALTQAEVGEDVVYDVALQALPDAAESRWVPQLTLYLDIAGPSEGTRAFVAPILKPYALTYEEVQMIALAALADLQVSRDRVRAGGSEDEFTRLDASLAPNPNASGTLAAEGFVVPDNGRAG